MKLSCMSKPTVEKERLKGVVVRKWEHYSSDVPTTSYFSLTIY